MHNTGTCLLLQSLSSPFAVPNCLLNSNEADNEHCKMTASRSLEFPSRAAALQDKISFHLTKKFVFKYVSLRHLGNPVDNVTDCFNSWILTQEAPQERATPFLAVKEERLHCATANVLRTRASGERRRPFTSHLQTESQNVSVSYLAHSLSILRELKDSHLL